MNHLALIEQDKYRDLIFLRIHIADHLDHRRLCPGASKRIDHK